ncbi:hypothetical protein KQX54_017608 [Cotesia glomerata]|uniref:Uncharacterized protein n=1 Tax=Cotesia glomerata TaxID=32391 RepID=A0AAV7HYF8_COTGL|nr:hypothetical protein KQX54_017608 [Cotesia glomerata]
MLDKRPQSSCEREFAPRHVGTPSGQRYHHHHHHHHHRGWQRAFPRWTTITTINSVVTSTGRLLGSIQCILVLVLKWLPRIMRALQVWLMVNVESRSLTILQLRDLPARILRYSFTSSCTLTLVQSPLTGLRGNKRVEK